jgi:exosortase E/protease (VPEID-CTERM system)
MSVVEREDTGAIDSLPFAPAAPWEIPRYLLGRIYVCGAVLLIEYTTIVSLKRPWCNLHQAVAGGIVFLAVLIFIGRPHLKADRTPLKINFLLLGLYVASLVVIAFAHYTLLTTIWVGNPLVAVWFATIPLSAALLLFALIPARIMPSVLRRTRFAWLYASVAALLAVSVSNPLQAMWNAPQSWLGLLLQRTTFDVVGRVLRLLYPHVSFDASTSIIALPNFAVIIGGTCSGIEGLSLTLMFCSGWLWYARRELRFPRALLLVPCAMILIWILNIVRLVALLSIGNWGHPAVADQGFHSEAGWIAFNIVALGFLAIANRLPWLARDGSSITRQEIACKTTADQQVERNVTAIYLLPFLAILAAGMVSKATSSGFEWAYPLRFIAAAVVLWHYRAEYRRIDWKFSWRGLGVGALVFAMWIGLSHWTNGPANDELGTALKGLPSSPRIVWLIIRVAAAVITVPIAEELAFRGFLLRRIGSPDVESVAYRTVTALAIVLSSVSFGLMHGKLWIAGTVAGAAYALLVKRTGRLGEAVAAHAMTNLMLAVWVLTRGAWNLW